MEKYIKPTRNLVLVEFEKPECEVRSGIIIPEMAHLEMKQRNAVVVAVGPKVQDLKKGDRVLVKPYGTLKRFGSNLALYDISDIFGIVTDNWAGPN